MAEDVAVLERSVSMLVRHDADLRTRDEESGGRIWEVLGRFRGDQINYLAATWLPGGVARDIQKANLLLGNGLLGDGSPLDPQAKLLIMSTVRRINHFIVAWMRGEDERADELAQRLKERVYEGFMLLNQQGEGLATYLNDGDHILGILAGITRDTLKQREVYNENKAQYIRAERLWFGHRDPQFGNLRMLADRGGNFALQWILNTLYTPIVAAITRWGRVSRLIETPVRATVYDDESGREVEVEVYTGIKAFRRLGPIGNQVIIATAGSRPLGDGEGLVLANAELAGIRAAVTEERGAIVSWGEYEAVIRLKMEEDGVDMPEEPDIVQAAEGIMFGKRLLYAIFGGVYAFYLDMSRFAHEKPHDPKTWIKVLKTMLGEIALGLNMEDTRFPAVLNIERAVKAEFPELPILLDDSTGTVVITRVGVEAAMVRTGRRTREEIETGRRTLEGMAFVVAGAGTAGGELVKELAEKGASVYCVDSKGGLNRARLEIEAKSSDSLRAAKAKEKLALLDKEGVEEAQEGETFRDIIERLERERTLVDGVIDLSGDPKLGQIDPATGRRYDTPIEEFLATHLARNPIVFSLTNPTPPIDVVEFLREVKKQDKADLIDESDPSKGVRVAVATGRGGTISDDALAQWFGQKLIDMVNNNFVFPVLMRICLDACSPLTYEIRDAVVRSYALSAIDIGRVTPDMWNPEHFAQAVKAGILAARNSGTARMIMDHTGKVRWLRTVEQSMQIVRDSMNFFIKMSAHPEIRRQIEDVVGCQLFV